jgi:cellulose synthase/poly-beta-1,6-N-acetylglucosamine synthase-like glycosyltransferase/peptidoglycan/xylan/chitin deacetylase (PgdA/CDA1 family)
VQFRHLFTMPTLDVQARAVDISDETTNLSGGPHSTAGHRQSGAQGAKAVFHDPSRRRWHRIQLVAFLILITIVVAGLYSWPRLMQSPASKKGTPTSPINWSLLQSDMPVVGDGPLVRLVSITLNGADVQAVDPFTHAGLGNLTEDDAQTVTIGSYALERYGYDENLTHDMSITFDDGPDPRWTPKLLDYLESQHVRATFFVTGKQVTRYPAIVRRILRDGHAIGNHSFSHPNLSKASEWRVQEEIVATDHVIRAETGHYSSIFRPPYDGGSDSVDIRLAATEIARAQQLGYAVASYTWDSSDWRHLVDPKTGAPLPAALPPLDGVNQTIVLHDFGTDRKATLAYVKELVERGKQAGYRFSTLPELAPNNSNLVGSAKSTLWDRVADQLAKVVLLWRQRLLAWMFAFTIGLALIGMVSNVVLATTRRLRSRKTKALLPSPADYHPMVSVVVAAYNEQEVIRKTINALTSSTYRRLEIVVVNDGSTDNTGSILDGISAVEPRLRVYHLPNGGKASALNLAVREATGEVIVSIDADTVFRPDTVWNLVRHFADPSVGGVGGVIRVGNRRNFITRWQALEYFIGVAMERGAQEAMRGAVMVLPGACSAWRRDAVLDAGGFSTNTLAEDFDLTLKVHRLGYRLTQDDEALADTEAPEKIGPFYKQRLRWMFGGLQVIYTNRDMLFRPRYGLLGTVVLPFAAISLLVPLMMPLVYVSAAAAIRDGNGVDAAILFLLLFLATRFVVSLVGIWLAGESYAYLLMVPVHRLVYEPLHIYLVYKTCYMAVKGLPLGWNKLQRTGAVGADGGSGAHPARLGSPNRQGPITVGAFRPVHEHELQES